MTDLEEFFEILKDMPGMNTVEFRHFDEEINAEAKRSAKAAGRGEDCNIEDQIRVANELLRGLEIVASSFDGFEDKVVRLKSDIKTVFKEGHVRVTTVEKAAVKVMFSSIGYNLYNLYGLVNKEMG